MTLPTLPPTPPSRRLRRGIALGCAVVALATLAIGSPSTAAPAAQSARPAELLESSDLDPSEDTFVSSERPSTNFGNEDWLYIGWRDGYGAVRGLLEFDLDDLPRDQAITRAELRMTLREAGPPGDRRRDLVLRQVTASWSEGSATWENFPDYDDDRIASEDVGTGGGRVTWRSNDLTALVQAWRWPEWQEEIYEKNRGLYLQGYEAEGSYRVFDSDEGRDEPSLRITHVTDALAPTAELEPLPEFHNRPDPDQPNTALIELEWRFEDPEPATGVEFFRVERQLRDGPLQLVADELQQTQLTVRAANGERVGYLVAATDVAGNVERREGIEVETLVDLSPPMVRVDPLPTYVTGPFELTWGGFDEPRGMTLENSGIKTYDVFHNINDGGWGGLKIGTTETTMTIMPHHDASYAFRARGIDFAGNVQDVGAAQATVIADMAAPRVLFEPVPGIDHERFTVRWRAVDPGARASGAAGVDLQYRVDGGAWRDWASNTAETERVFEGEFSHVYEFRARARDTAGNEGTWPSEAGLVVGVIDRATLTRTVLLPYTSVR